MAGALMGRECLLAYNTGTFGTPTWTTVTRAMDVGISFPAERGDLSSRISSWKMEGKALTGLEVTFGYRYRYNVTDSVWDALRVLAMGVTKQELAVADGVIATSGTNYLRATFQFEMNLNQPLTDGVAAEFTAFLTSEEDSGTIREPSWTET